jgi:DNA-binding FadR family transcriptional regulator
VHLDAVAEGASRPTRVGATRVSTSSTIDACVSDVKADTAWWAARRADADDIAALELLVAETRRLLKQITDDWTPLTEADARWHEALARATKNRLRIGISLGLHEPRLRQAPALGDAHARYARTIPTALAKITRAVKAHDAEQARSAMRDHVARWASLNPDVSDLGADSSFGPQA